MAFLLQRMRGAYFLTFFVYISFLGGCASRDYNENDPASIYSAAEEDVKDAQYSLALEKLQKVKNRFPYSKYSTDAQLRIADVYFLQESWVEAAASYEVFRDLHPKHERVAYAIYRSGMSYFNDIPSTVARDMTPAQKALEFFDEFLRRFPKDEQVAEVSKKRDETINLLAQKEMYIADFYYKREIWVSAEPRYQRVTSLYPTSKFADKAKAKMAEIEIKRKKTESNE